MSSIFKPFSSSFNIEKSGWFPLSKHVHDLHVHVSSLVLLHNIFLAKSFAIIFLPIPSVPSKKI